MTAPIPLTAHEELDLLDEIEQALVRLTTAELEQREVASHAVFAPVQLPSTATIKTVIPAKAGTHNP